MEGNHKYGYKIREKNRQRKEKGKKNAMLVGHHIPNHLPS